MLKAFILTASTIALTMTHLFLNVSHLSRVQPVPMLTLPVTNASSLERRPLQDGAVWEWLPPKGGPNCQIVDYQLVNGRIFFGGGYGCALGELISQADPSTFVELEVNGEEQGWAKDENHVYYGDSILPSADPLTFELESDGTGYPVYGKDKTHVYAVDGNLVYGADPSTYHLIGFVTTAAFETGEYAVDKNHVYYFNSVVLGASPNTFRFTGLETYSLGTVPNYSAVKCADSNLYYDSADSGNLYYSGQKMQCDNTNVGR